MHHRHDNLFLGAVLEAQQEESVAFMTGGVGGGTHNALLLPDKPALRAPTP